MHRSDRRQGPASIHGLRVLLLGLALLGACSGGSEETVTAGSELTPVDAVDALKIALGAAHRAWSEGERAEAQRLVRESYRTHFEPLEPALRAHDPLGTLELEFAFGRLEQTFGKPGNPVEVIEEVRALNRAVAAAVAALPTNDEAAP